MSQRQDKDEKQPAVETDPRFPSGPWVGFWIQRIWGKQKMSLSLTFIEGLVKGSGRDVVGPFAFDGSYDLKTGRVRMMKHYEGAHRVAYDGANQGDGQWLWGVWTVGLNLDRGGFHLWPEGEDDPTQGKLESARDLPAPQERRRRVVAWEPAHSRGTLDEQQEKVPHGDVLRPGFGSPSALRGSLVSLKPPPPRRITSGQLSDLLKLDGRARVRDARTAADGLAKQRRGIP